MTALQQQPLYLDVDEHKLHLRHIRSDAAQTKGAVLMVHGSIENGRIFYNDKGKGLGCFLANQGFDVYVLDLRGRGLSQPSIAKGHRHGQQESILKDIPRAIEYVAKRHHQKLHCVAHSWGGVLLMAALIRLPHLLDLIDRQVFFGTKRSVRVHNPERWLKLELVWKRLGPILNLIYGYFPAKKLGIGADNEPAAVIREISRWLSQSAWRDSDGFDYQAAAAKLTLPSTWFITGSHDKALGHARDMRRFAHELGMAHHPVTVLGKEAGARRDYGHVDILTHPACAEDHFPAVASWLENGTQVS
ncbi:alpha/beta fold hydrolase [Aliiglaciecola sp. CAU 1673]|uniref:alpha/beta hydrolase family protein n=1 Tax=Aliiglaciecola sp. CAU 1673 TaxID=3032595 RepID=UPI0023DA7DB8|nr:alpha/beta fold hydrolase [Aliiglaciecola sp. CAU 1673]MDF2178007.1 alpha/beta fold hydrolase [Aliiglaciecola sp. CAU 1673]